MMGRCWRGAVVDKSPRMRVVGAVAGGGRGRQWSQTGPPQLAEEDAQHLSPTHTRRASVNSSALVYQVPA